MEILPRPAVPALAPWDALIRFGAGKARLPGRASEFDVTVRACDNPACTCEVVTLSFRELVARPRAATVAFDVSVDLASDAPAETKGLGAESERLAARVAEALGASTRALPRAALREKRRRLKRIPETVAEYVRQGEMVPYSHVIAGGLPDDKETYGFLDALHGEQLDWNVLDYFCGRSACRCEEVRLAFHGADPEGEVEGAHFGVRVPLGKGPPSFEDLDGISLSDARSVYAVWEATTGYDRAALRAKYDNVKAMAKRGAVTTSPPRGIGRRDPCPCGSGKRYKNCCGRD